MHSRSRTSFRIYSVRRPYYLVTFPFLAASASPRGPLADLDRLDRRQPTGDRSASFCVVLRARSRGPSTFVEIVELRAASAAVTVLRLSRRRMMPSQPSSRHHWARQLLRILKAA